MQAVLSFNYSGNHLSFFMNTDNTEQTQVSPNETEGNAGVSAPLASDVADAARAERRAIPRGGSGGSRGGGRGGSGGAGGARRRGTPRRDGGGDRPRAEFDQKTIVVRRVARVMAGGRRFSFSAAVVIGNRQGKVGVGLGKGADTALALDKAVANAKRHMFLVPLTKAHSLPHRTEAKYASSSVIMIPVPGVGLKAGSAVRSVLELAGVTDVSAKILSRSKNQLNNARAAMKALALLKAKKEK